MIVYSQPIVKFIQEIKFSLRNILTKEVGLKVFGDRFYDSDQRFSYPISVVIYNHKSMLGYFDADFYELGFHECLMHVSHEQLQNVIRHELAHFLTYIRYGNGVQPHGGEFRTFCQRMGWGEEVYQATTCLHDEIAIAKKEVSAVFRKVQKLMALATSSNQNEAEQAMIKSQQLLLKHNLEAEYIKCDTAEKFFLKRLMKQKKENAKMRAVARILETFFVNVIYKRTAGFIYLEILGGAVNLEIAEYVADILDRELDRLWLQAKKEANLKGMVAKNSFFHGIAKGYCQKIHSLKRAYNSEVTQALMVIENQLSQAKGMVYARLSSGKSRRNYCPESAKLGEQMGRALHIHSALQKSPEKSEALLAFGVK